MTPLTVLLWIANVCVDTLGQTAFKLSASASHNREGWYYWTDVFSNYWLWIGIFSYVAEFLLWLAFLTLVPLYQAVLLGSVNIIAIMIAGRILFDEKLTPFRVVGIICITCGVALVGAS